MKVRIFFMFAVCGLLFGCESKENQYAVVPFGEGVDRTEAVGLSAFAKSVSYIPFETVDESLISRTRDNVQMTAKYIFIHCRQNLLQFDRTGKFIRTVGKVGQGPGEYNSLFHYNVNERTDRIHILSNGRMLNYTVDGDFINAFPVVEALQFGLVNDSTIAAFKYNITGNEEKILYLYNLTSGKEIGSFPQYERFSTANGALIMSTSDRYFYAYNDKLYFTDQYNDTLFRVTEKELIPTYIFDSGRYKLPDDNRAEKNMPLFSQTASSYYKYGVIESAKYLFLPYSAWAGNERKLAVFDKTSLACFSVKDRYIDNDLDGGLPFRPITAQGNQLLSLWEAADILDYFKNNPKAKMPDAIKNIVEDDNPVLMIVDYM